jgi:hypothetical protein
MTAVPAKRNSKKCVGADLGFRIDGATSSAHESDSWEI